MNISSSQTTGEGEGMSTILQEMGVEDGGGVSFSDFWKLIDKLATSQLGVLSQEKTTKCMKCVLFWAWKWFLSISENRFTLCFVKPAQPGEAFRLAHLTLPLIPSCWFHTALPDSVLWKLLTCFTTLLIKRDSASSFRHLLLAYDRTLQLSVHGLCRPVISGATVNKCVFTRLMRMY